MRTGWLMVLALVASGAQAQRYERRPDPANPDAFDRYQARVTPGGAAAVIGASAAGVAAGYNPHEPSSPPTRGRSEQARRRIAQSGYIGPSFTVPVIHPSH